MNSEIQSEIMEHLVHITARLGEMSTHIGEIKETANRVMDVMESTLYYAENKAITMNTPS